MRIFFRSILGISLNHEKVNPLSTMNAYMRSHITIQFRIKVALKWRDKKDVWMLSTSHSDDFVEIKKTNYQTGKLKRKPKYVADYNALTGAVDKIGMILSSQFGKAQNGIKIFFLPLRPRYI